MKKELCRIGYKNLAIIPFSDVTTKLLYLMTSQHDRVMAKSPAEIVKNLKRGVEKR
jgi:hypothetical protein